MQFDHLPPDRLRRAVNLFAYMRRAPWRQHGMAADNMGYALLSIASGISADEVRQTVCDLRDAGAIDAWSVPAERIPAITLACDRGRYGRESTDVLSAANFVVMELTRRPKEGLRIFDVLDVMARAGYTMWDAWKGADFAVEAGWARSHEVHIDELHHWQVYTLATEAFAAQPIA